MQRKVYQWAEISKSGRTSVIDKDCLGHWNTSWMTDNAEKLIFWFKRADRLAVTNTVNKLDVSCLSAYSINHKNLGCHKICARWIPKQFYRWALTGTCGKVHTIVAVTFWRSRGFPAMDCHRWWHIGAPLWTFKQVSKHAVEAYIITQDQEIWQSDVDTVLGL